MKALSKDGAPDPGPTSSQSAAHKVFEVTELQELILNHVSLCDLFRAASVCRVWKTTFTDSSALQKKAQLVADPESDWYEDEFDDEFGLVIDCTVRNIVEQCRVGFELFFVFGSFEHVPAKITPNLRKCFATQPPCTEMEVSPFCCPDAEEILRNSKGITLGDVFDTANRIYAEHEHCPEMLRKIKEMAETDMPWSRYPRFRGSVSHSKDHPARVREVRRLARVEEEHKQRMKALEDAGWGDVWYAFRKARRRAAAISAELPTWPVFLAQHQDLVPVGYKLNAAEADAGNRSRSLTHSETWHEHDVESSSEEEDSDDNGTDGAVSDDEDEATEEDASGEKGVAEDEEPEPIEASTSSDANVGNTWLPLL